jgi:hypothetical protein
MLSFSEPRPSRNSADIEAPSLYLQSIKIDAIDPVRQPVSKLCSIGFNDMAA